MTGQYQQRHMAVFPDPAGSIDLLSQSRDCSGVWWREPKPALASIVFPKMISAASRGEDLTYSSFRKFGLFDPASLALPGGDFTCRIFLPAGEPFTSETWCSLFWCDPRRDPIAGERFIASGGGLKLQLQRVFDQQIIDGLRDLNKRVRQEVWVRHNWKASEIAPGVLPVPALMQSLAGLSPEDAAARLNSLRGAQMSPAEYYALRKKEREERERKEEQEGAEAFARQALKEARTAAEAPPVADVPTEPEAPPEKPYRDRVRDAKTKRERIAKVTQASARAIEANKASGKAFAEKKLRQYEREGKV